MFEVDFMVRSQIMFVPWAECKKLVLFYYAKSSSCGGRMLEIGLVVPSQTIFVPRANVSGLVVARQTMFVP
jgi:hypothetical protein